MKSVRTLSTTRLLGLATSVVVLCAAVAALAVAAAGSSGDTPPPKPLAHAVHDALTAPPVEGVTARVTFTNRLFPSGALLGSAGPVLMSGGSGRLWMNSDGKGRIELQSNAGDAQIVWTPSDISIYDASSNTVYHAGLPAKKAGSDGADSQPTLAQITDALTQLGIHAALSGADPTNIGGVPAYNLTASPKHDGGMLGSIQIAWDASHAVPLRVAVYAQGETTPVLALTTSSITYGPVNASALDAGHLADAKVVDLGSIAPSDGTKHGAAVKGLADVQAKAGFAVVAPETLVGLPRRDVRLVGEGDSAAAVVTYGQGLGAVVVVQRTAPTDSKSGGVVDSLPTVSLDGVTAHELATQLGTIVAWEQNGISWTLAGSIPAAAAEAAARELK